MTKQLSILAAAITAASLFSATAQASGFRLNETSTSGMGTAYAGRGALVEDASIVYYNPAGMSKLKQAELSIGASYLDIHGSFSNASRTNPAGIPSAYEPAYNDSGDMFPASVIPFAYYARPLNEKIAFGFGVFVPFGTNSEYGNNSFAGGFARETKVTSLELQPTISYKISETFSVGVGLDIVYINGVLSKDLDLLPFIPSPLRETVAAELGVPESYLPTQLSEASSLGYENTWEVEGDDIAVGFNVGFMWDISPATSLGLTYRSAIDFELEGKSRFVDDTEVQYFDAATMSVKTLGSASNWSQESRVPLAGPQSAVLSVAHKLTDRLNLLGSVTWVDWSSFKKLDVNGTEPGVFSSLSGLGQNKIGHIDESWRDTYSFSLGASYALNDQWLLRAGYMFDQTAVTDEYRTARVPDNNRQWFNVGARYTANTKLSFDLAAAYMFMDKSSLNEFNKDLNDNRTGSDSLTGEFDLSAFGLSFQMNYRM